MQPRINTYIDLTAFYQDYFKYRKQQDSSFSYEIWSSELGFKSRTFMNLIASGQRSTTAKLIEVFSEKNNFNKIEKRHFINAALYHKAKSDLQKKMHYDELIQTLDSSNNLTQIENYSDFLSSLELPLIQLILAFDGVSRTEKQLAKTMGLGLKQVQSKLKKLETLGMAYKEKNTWKSKYSSFEIPDAVRSQALKKYHDQNLKEAQDIIYQDELQRRFRTIMFALNDKNFSELTEDVEAFLTKLRHKYGTMKSKTDKVYKLNLQTYPATKELAE